MPFVSLSVSNRRFGSAHFQYGFLVRSLNPKSKTDGSRNKPVARNAFSFAKWTMKNFCELEIVKIREQVGPTDYVLGGISGGVDSSVAAGLMHRALGERFRPFLIDTGLLRKDEAQEVQTRLTQHIPGLKLQCVDASAEFYQALHGVTEPERKRKIIGKLFIDAFERAIRESDLPIESTYLLQGTLYPDYPTKKLFHCDDFARSASQVCYT